MTAAPGGDRAQLEFFETAERAFEAAAQAAGATELDYQLGGRRLRLRLAGAGPLETLTPALAHARLAAPAGPPDLTLCLWDNASTGTRLPLLLGHLAQSLAVAWAQFLDPRGQVSAFSGGRIRTAFHPGPNILSIYDEARRLGLYWVEDARALPYFERGSPLRTLLHWWAQGAAQQFVHAAGVGGPAGGVLLVGKGGSGKSTTALACLEGGLHFAGDDYCLLDTASDTVHCAYSTAKLVGAQDLARFPGLAALCENPDRLADEKALLFLHERFGQRVAASLPLRAVLLPRVTGGPHTSLQRISPGAALAALAPTTLAQLPGAGQDAMRLMAGVLTRVPCFRLDLGHQLEGIAPVIAAYLERGA